MKKLILLFALIIFLGNYYKTLGQAVATVHGPVPIDTAARFREIRQNINFLTLAIKQSRTGNALALAGAHLLRGTDEAALNQNSKAMEDYSVAIRLNPRLKDAYWNRALLYEKNNNFQSAQIDYEKTLSLGNNTAVQVAILNNNVANMQKRLRNYDQALLSDSVAIAAEPRYTPSYVNRAEVYLITRKYDMAINDLTIALNGNYNKQMLSIIITERGDAKRFLKKYGDAINDYSVAIQLNPDNKIAYWNRAASYNNNGDYELANNDYTRAITYYKGDNQNLSRLYDDRALMEIGLQQYKKAISDDSVAIALDSKFALAHWNQAVAYAQDADFQRGVDGYIKTMNFYQYDKIALAQLFNNIADAEYFLNDYQKVIDYSSSAIGIDERSSGAYLNRGRAYLKQMNKSLAMDDFSKVLALDTSKKTFAYAFALFYTGNADKAIAIMQNNVISTTNNEMLRSHYYNLACLYSLMNKPDEANIYLKKCIDEGYPKKYALADPDLDNIRNTKEYKENIK